MQRVASSFVPRCVFSARRALSVAPLIRAAEPRAKVRSMPAPGDKLPPRPKLEPLAMPFQNAASAQEQQEWSFVNEEDVKQRVYTFEPPGNPAFFYVGVIALFFLGVNVADAYRLDSLGSLSRPLLPTVEKQGREKLEGSKYIEGAWYILAGTTALCAVLAYIPTRHVTTLTVVPRFPRPASDQHRIAWYHHSDCIIHSTSDFIALPLASFRKGKRVPFSTLRLRKPLTSRPSPSEQVGGQSATASKARPKRAGSIFLMNDAFPALTQYYLARPGAPNVKVECDDILVLERALQFNVEKQWKAREELKQKAQN